MEVNEILSIIKAFFKAILNVLKALGLDVDTSKFDEETEAPAET